MIFYLQRLTFNIKSDLIIVSEIVSILIEEQWIQEKPSEIKVRGRQPIPLDINKEKKCKGLHLILNQI